MAKTNWQDPKTSEILSTHTSGLQEAVGKIEESIGMESVAETDIPLSEVFISNDDRCRIYQAPEGKRNWLLSPAPIIKKNGDIITDDFEVDYGGGAVVFTTPIMEDDILTADATYTVPIKDKQLSTEDFTTDNKEKLLGISTAATKAENSETNGNIRIDDSEQIVYTHPETAGNKHIPSGGEVGQILKNTSSGTATWQDENITTIVNNLDETETGKALDATQGKILNQQLKEMATKKELDQVSKLAPLSARAIPTTPEDYTSIFRFAGLKDGSELNFPETLAHVFGINGHPDLSAGVHELAFGGVGGKLYHRSNLNSDRTRWGEWRQIATTDKIEIPFPFDAGYLQDSDIFRSLLVVNPTLRTCRLYFSIRKTDGSNFEKHPTGAFRIGTLPTTYRPKASMMLTLSPATAGLTTGESNLILRTNGSCELVCGHTTADRFFTTTEWDY